MRYSAVRFFTIEVSYEGFGPNKKGGVEVKFQIMLAVISIFASTAVAQAAEVDLYRHPVINSYGGVVTSLGTAELPRKNAKVVYDITSATMDGGVIKGLDRAALLINLYVESGLKTQDLQLAIVLHGDATKAALVDSAYRRVSDGKDNPSREIIRLLRGNGVEIYVCLQALIHHGYNPENILPDVIIAASAVTVNINKQMDGYAYLPFH